MTTTQAQDVPVAVHAHTSQAGQPYVEAQVTGTAAINLARAVVQRLAGQGVVGPRITESLVALVAGAVTDHPVELTVEQALDLSDALDAAVAVAEGAAGLWGESA